MSFKDFFSGKDNNGVSPFAIYLIIAIIILAYVGIFTDYMLRDLIADIKGLF